MNINALITKRNELKEDIKLKTEEIDTIKDEIDLLEIEIMSIMQKEGTEKVSCNGTTAWIKSEIAPKVDDWSKVYEFIQNNNRFDLLNKTIKKTTFKEFVDGGKMIPGCSIKAFDKISFRKS